MVQITKPRALLLLAAGVLLGGVAATSDPARAGEKDEALVVTIRLPADAVLLIDEHPMKLTGAVRVFRTPPLRVGGHYVYTLKATSRGKEVTRKAHLAHGMDNAFDLRAEFLPAAKDTAHPKQFTASAENEMPGLFAAMIWGAALRTVEEALDKQPPDGSRFPK